VIVVMVMTSVGLLYLPVAMGRLGRRMEARRWYRAVVVSLFTGAVGLYVAVVSVALPEVLRVLGAERLARICDELLGHLPHGGSFVGWAAFVVAVAMSVASWWTLRVLAHALAGLRVEPGIGRHLPLGGLELVVLPTDEQIAYSRQGRPGQIVISEGTIDALTGPEIDVLIQHERAHLERGHEPVLRGLIVVRRIYGWMPGIRTSVEIARLAIERDADELAAGTVMSKRAALADALLSLSIRSLPEMLPAFAGCDALDERIAWMRGEMTPLGARQQKLVGALLAVIPLGSVPILALPMLFLVGACTG
jgi:Zn-dependent protease with chaperone function